MDEPDASPIPYNVVYSERVRTELRELLLRARAANRGQEALAAIKQIDSRLLIYPQFGEPLQQLTTNEETLWIGAISPLVTRYIIDEDERIVFVVVPIMALPNSGF